MPRFFDRDGDEFKYAADRNAEIIGEIGGKPEKTSVTISVYSGRLDKDQVTKLLEVNPTKAWNPNERRASGYHGRTRVDDWGKWFLSTETNDKPLNEKIEKLFSICTRNLSDWHLLSEEYETWLTIVGHINNWNREIHLSRTTLKLIGERNLALTYDIYFDEEDNGE